MGRYKDMLTPERWDDWDRASPSQMTTFDLCPRKWHWTKIEGFEDAGTAATNWGGERHDELQLFIEGKSDVLHARCEPGRHHFEELRALHEMGLAKCEGDILIPGYLVDITGRVDVMRMDGIEDHKTSSNIDKWAKSEDQLRLDNQVNVYAKYFFMTHPEENSATITYNYIQSKGPKRFHQVSFTLTRDEVNLFFRTNIEPKLELMMEYSKRKAMDVPMKRSGCSAFGGCPHAERCGLSKESAPVDRQEMTMAFKKFKKKDAPKKDGLTFEQAKAKHEAGEQVTLTDITDKAERMQFIDYKKAIAANKDPERAKASGMFPADVGRDPEPGGSEPGGSEPGASEPKEEPKVTELDTIKQLSKPLREHFKSKGLETLGEVVVSCTREELLDVRGAGEAAVNKLETVLEARGFKLKDGALHEGAPDFEPSEGGESDEGEEAVEEGSPSLESAVKPRGYTLITGCTVSSAIPPGVLSSKQVDLHRLVAEIGVDVAEQQNVRHFLLAPYNKGPALVAAIVDTLIDEGEFDGKMVICIDPYSAGVQPSVEVLRAKCGVEVRGVK